MDVPLLLRSARLSAQLSKKGLARAAGTSPAAIGAYEAGTRSPTTTTFARLLAACGLQVRGELEPLHAEVTSVVETLLAGTTAGVPEHFGQLAERFEAAGLVWALDGVSAMAAHGLAATMPSAMEIAVVDVPALREVLTDLWAKPVDAHGMTIFVGWRDLDLTALGPKPMYTRRGYLRMRVVDQLPAVGRLQVALLDPYAEGEPQAAVLPVLGLLDVEQAHPAHAAVLAEVRARRTVVAWTTA